MLATTLWLLLAVVPSAAAPAAGDAAAPVAPAAPPAGRLEGRASLGRNRPVIGATVVIFAEDRPTEIRAATSDAHGHFEFDGLRDGRYRVEVSREGLDRVVKDDVELRFPFRAVVEVTLHPIGAPAAPAAAPEEVPDQTVALRGVVADSSGAPLPDVPVRLIESGGLTDPRLARSGSDGAFEIAGLPAGVWALEAHAVGFLALRARLRLAADGEIDIHLAPQPPGFDPSPLDLMPREEPMPPPRFERPPIGGPAGSARGPRLR